MTQRKPWDLSFDSWIDVQIREAKERGLFDELSGAGKPQANLRDANDPMWWAKQLLRREELSVLPPAIEVRVRAQKLREVLASFPSERTLREAAEALNADIRRVNRTASDGPPTTQAPLDVETLAAQWNAARARGGALPVNDGRANAEALSLAGRDAPERESGAVPRRRAFLSIRPSSGRRR
jgi:Domain of unknown function (DUF1992)